MALPPLTTTIGTVQFMGWTPWVPSYQNQADRFKRLGQIASGAQITGQSDDPKDYEAWRLFTSVSEAVNFIGTVEELPVDTYTMTDQWGAQFKVRVYSVKSKLRAGRGVGNLLVECTINLEYIGAT